MDIGVKATIATLAACVVALALLPAPSARGAGSGPIWTALNLGTNQNVLAVDYVSASRVVIGTVTGQIFYRDPTKPATRHGDRDDVSVSVLDVHVRGGLFRCIGARTAFRSGPSTAP